MFSKRKIVFFILIIITTVFFIIGCTSSYAALPKKAGNESKAPEWVNSKNADNNYFIGIGFSNSGNETNDLNIAKKKAFSALISTIFANIKKSQEFVLDANADKKYFDSAEAHITQSLTRNYTDVKSDSYYDENKGNWFYYKISKDDWSRIEKEEKQEIADFLNEVLSPKLLSKDLTDFEILSSLINGWKFLAESPYPELIYGTLANDKGLLIDIIENNISKIFSRLVINIDPNPILTEPGRSENIIISILDKDGRNPGQFQINFYNKADEKEIAQITTEMDGTYSGKIEFKGIPMGKQQLYAQFSMPYLEFNPEFFKKKMPIPSKEFTVTVNEISVVLKLIVNGEADITKFTDQTKSLFSKKDLTLKLSPGDKNERNAILFTIYFKNQPENSHGLFITNADATIVLVKDGNNIFSYKTPEYREVGLDWNQAQERVAIKMFGDINNDELFFKELHKALYEGTIFESK